ncbi:hypothetical protein GCM10010121_095270 [Streptomyces brasiliensis]|uniref:Uncharacterized protein n=1 Tax=Streptomyces brasiliensis TaxID=1954 RepID=A0A917UN33_9ACTN|nr:hypothetical protein GCM10010121_095270 [Streptomyces brasiliensis]
MVQELDSLQDVRDAENVLVAAHVSDPLDSQEQVSSVRVLRQRCLESRDPDWAGANPLHGHTKKGEVPVVRTFSNDLQILRPARWFWLITVIVVIIVATAPWAGEPVATAAIGLLTTALPLAARARLEGTNLIVAPGAEG